MSNITDDNDYYFRLKGNCTCGHLAHCGHSCVDEECDDCTECRCYSCQQEAEKSLGYN